MTISLLKRPNKKYKTQRINGLGDKLLVLRERAGFEREDIATRLRVTPQAVGCWERGNNEPSLDRIRTMAKLYGVSADYLLDLEPENDGK